jgi:hypothetical protein
MEKEEKAEIEVTVKATTIVKKAPRQLRVPLTEKQFVEFGMKLADAQGRLTALDGQKESFMTQWKADQKTVEGEVGKYASIIREKSIYCEVECTTELNFKTKIYTVVRNDTGELLESRSMTSEELQRLPMEFDATEKLEDADFSDDEGDK